MKKNYCKIENALNKKTGQNMNRYLFGLFLRLGILIVGLRPALDIFRLGITPISQI